MVLAPWATIGENAVNALLEEHPVRTDRDQLHMTAEIPLTRLKITYLSSPELLKMSSKCM